MIKINGRVADNSELEAIFREIDPKHFEDILRAMLYAAPDEALLAMREAIATLKSERNASDPNTNH